MKKKKKLAILCVILTGCVLLLAAMVVLLRRQPSDGKEIYPVSDKMFETEVYYRQADTRWGSQTMGSSSDTLERSGCLVTCLAASMEMQMRRGDSSYRMSPGNLNEELTAHQVYDDHGNILWHPLRDYLTDWTVETPSRVDGEQIEAMVRAGNYPIVKVHMPVSHANHWVVLIRAKDGEYLCMDPLAKSNEPVSLSVYGNKVYAVRCIKLSNLP